MVVQARNSEELSIEIAGSRMRVLKGGQGPPLLLLPTDVGSPGWLPFHEALAERFTVYAASHPGYDGSDVPEWARDVRDLAQMHQWLLKELRLESLTIIGLGFGGWIAAEMATMCHHRFQRLVLVGAAGLQPSAGEILDQFLVSSTEYVREGFHDQAAFVRLYGEEPDPDQLEVWELNREMSTRVAWSPYMFSQSLPHLLGGIDAPALLVWGKEDAIVPLSSAGRYQQLLPNARLAIVEGCGHFVDVEKPDELARLVIDFVGAS